MMILLFEMGLPFKDPVLVFAVVLLVILLSPILFSKIKIPGLVGLILAGVILGPHGFHILARDPSIILFGTVGLLYIMFLAGLEMDMNDFRKNRNKGLTFGALTFLVPFTIGFTTFYYILNYNLTASVLLASMFSTHTLITYPIISRLGITQSRSVTVTIGGTIITDAIVLLILAFITNAQVNELNAMFFVKLLSLLGVLVFVILWGVPRLSRWFFQSLESEGYSQYVYVLSIVFLCGFAAHLVGVEPIIGAFLAGLALNQLIPHTSTLMNRIDFVGNSLFIPFFLISVGMLVDVRVLFRGPEALFLSGLIIAISFTGKWIAALLTAKIYNYSVTERNLIWGMSSAHAAATIAVVLIGFNLRLFDESVLNGTIILILISCLGSSMITEHAGRKIALEEADKLPEPSARTEKILVPVANLENVERLLDLAMLIKNPKAQEPIFPLYVLKDDVKLDEKIVLYQKKMEKALKDVALETEKEPVFRVDVNVGNGVLRAIKELRITEIIMGWDGQVTPGRRLGNIGDRIIERTTLQLLLAKLVIPVNTIKRVVAVVPRNAEREKGFPGWVDTILQFTKEAGATLILNCTAKTHRYIEHYNQRRDGSISITFNAFDDWDDFLILTRGLEKHDLFLAVIARPHTVSYIPVMDRVPRYLANYFADTSCVVLYPEQEGKLR